MIHRFGTLEVAARTHKRGELDEVQFHWWHSRTLLPVQFDGALRLLPWGSKSRRSRLPHGGWVRKEHVAEGLLAASRPEPVVIPAVLGFESGMWFVIDSGIRGIVIHDATGPVVYMLTRPSTNYYRNMTQQTATMPVFVGQVI